MALAVPLSLVMIWPHHGLSYSNRHLLTVNFLLSIGAAHLFDRWSLRMKSMVCNVGGLILILWSYLQLCLFKIVVPHDSSNFVWQTFHSLKLFWKLPQLWSRGENFFFVLSRPAFLLQTPLDWYLIVIYPILQASILIILLFTGVYIWDKIRRHSELRFWALNSINLLTALFIISLHILINFQSDTRSQEFVYQRKAQAAGQFVLPLVGNQKANFRLQRTP